MPVSCTPAFSKAKKYRRQAIARLANLEEADLGPHDLRINASDGGFVQVHRIIAALLCPMFRSDTIYLGNTCDSKWDLQVLTAAKEFFYSCDYNLSMSPHSHSRCPEVARQTMTSTDLPLHVRVFRMSQDWQMPVLQDLALEKLQSELDDMFVSRPQYIEGDAALAAEMESCLGHAYNPSNNTVADQRLREKIVSVLLKHMSFISSRNAFKTMLERMRRTFHELDTIMGSECIVLSGDEEDIGGVVLGSTQPNGPTRIEDVELLGSNGGNSGRSTAMRVRENNLGGLRPSSSPERDDSADRDYSPSVAPSMLPDQLWRSRHHVPSELAREVANLRSSASPTPFQAPSPPSSPPISSYELSSESSVGPVPGNNSRRAVSLGDRRIPRVHCSRTSRAGAIPRRASHSRRCIRTSPNTTASSVGQSGDHGRTRRSPSAGAASSSSINIDDLPTTSWANMSSPDVPHRASSESSVAKRGRPTRTSGLLSDNLAARDSGIPSSETSCAPTMPFSDEPSAVESLSSGAVASSNRNAIYRTVAAVVIPRYSGPSTSAGLTSASRSPAYRVNKSSRRPAPYSCCIRCKKRKERCDRAARNGPCERCLKGNAICVPQRDEGYRSMAGEDSATG